MFFPLDRVGTGHIKDVPSNSLAFCHHKNTPALVLGNGDERFVIFLKADRVAEFSGFECSENENWQARFISDVTIQVDPKSGGSTLGYDLGAIKVTGGNAYLMANIKGDAFSEGQWIDIGKTHNSSELDAFFTDWRIVTMCDDKIMPLVTAKSQAIEINESLLQPDSEGDG